MYTQFLSLRPATRSMAEPLLFYTEFDPTVHSVDFFPCSFCYFIDEVDNRFLTKLSFECFSSKLYQSAGVLKTVNVFAKTWFSRTRPPECQCNLVLILSWHPALYSILQEIICNSSSSLHLTQPHSFMCRVLLQYIAKHSVCTVRTALFGNVEMLFVCSIFLHVIVVLTCQTSRGF